MGRLDDGLPEPRGGGGMLLLTRETYEKLRELANRETVMDPTQFEMIERDGKKYYRLRPQGPTQGAGGGGGGRFVPSVGGEGSTKLFISPGTVTYIRIAKEEPLDSEQPVCEQEMPIFPTIDETGIDEEPAPGFDISGKSSASVWLVTQRMKCPSSSFLPPPGESQERLEIYNRGQRPPRREGELHVLLAEMDFADADGAKSITNLVQYVESDFEVPFLCAEDEDSYDSQEDSGDDGFDSSDFTSSGETDDPDSSGDEVDCPWQLKARWVNKKGCYAEGVETVVGWRVGIGIRKLWFRCTGWKARITFLDGIPWPIGNQTVEGNSLVVPLSGMFSLIQARFRVYFPPDCKATALEVQIFSDPDSDSPPHECCGRTFQKEAPEFWPRYCNKSCTTVVPPP